MAWLYVPIDALEGLTANSPACYNQNHEQTQLYPPMQQTSSEAIVRRENDDPNGNSKRVRRISKKSFYGNAFLRNKIEKIYPKKPVGIKQSGMEGRQSRLQGFAFEGYKAAGATSFMRKMWNNNRKKVRVGKHEWGISRPKRLQKAMQVLSRKGGQHCRKSQDLVCVQEYPVLNWDLKSHFETLKPFVMSKGKPLAPPSLYRKWNKVSWMRLLSGLTLKPSLAVRGVERWISLQAGIRAKHLATLENAQEWIRPTHGIYGPTLHVLLVKSDHRYAFSRTYQATLNLDTDKSNEIYKIEDTELRAEYSARLKSGQATYGNGCSLWRTITAEDSADRAFARNSRGEPKLSAQAKLFSNGRPARTKYTPGAESLTEGRTLNPQFVEWLQGYPPEWINFEPSEIPLSRWLQRQRLALYGIE